MSLDPGAPARASVTAVTSSKPQPVVVEAAFEIVERNEIVYDDPDAGPKLTRVTMSKRYAGAIDGFGTVEVLTAQGERGSGYVASERVVGSLDGQEGTFVVQHAGLADDDTLNASGRIVPYSGTGELADIRGEARESRMGVLSLEYLL